MPWGAMSIMDQRREFVRLATQDGANRRELCRRFGIHPQTGYKWIDRWTSSGELADRSRRPHSSPGQTDPAIEQRVLSIRDAHPAWGARKIVHCLGREVSRHLQRQWFMPFCGAMTGSLRRREELQRISALRRKRRTFCGRWTSRAGLGSTTTVVAIR